MGITLWWVIGILAAAVLIALVVIYSASKDADDDY